MQNIKHKLISDTMTTALWIIAYIFVVPLFYYIKRKLQNTKTYNIISFWFYHKKLLNHRVFEKIKNLTSIRIPFNVISLGKKIAFGDMLELEARYLEMFLKIFTLKIIRNNDYGYIKNFIYYLKYTELMNSKQLILQLLTDYEEHVKLLPILMISELSENIEIRQVDLIKYIRSRYETLEISEIEIMNIKQEIKYRKMRRLINKYEEMMTVYRCQIIKNLACQLESDKPPHVLLEDVFTNSFLPVILNAQETIAMKINQLNGEFKTLVYKGHKLI
ncbi:MAG: hypothetical protein H7A25_22215 [Leptospiraceae bacterium]|nr:hypothetical protein [Leptospiraceae bacterium]MCP5502630.1 hypothetical protein [Leptospiraceae bacterium]